MSMRTQALSALFAIVLAACTNQAQQAPPKPTSAGAEPDELGEAPNEGGRPFLQDLKERVRAAERVVIVEHAYRYDAASSEDPNRKTPEIIYASVDLSLEQRNALIKMLDTIDPTTSMYASACLFEPHHRIEIYTKSARSNLEICLLCDQLEMDGAKTGEPPAFYEGFSSFLRTIGLHPTRDWRALAGGNRS